MKTLVAGLTSDYRTGKRNITTLAWFIENVGVSFHVAMFIATQGVKLPECVMYMLLSCPQLHVYIWAVRELLQLSVHILCV